MKRFVCGQVLQGCEHIFTGITDQDVLDQVVAHVAVDHDMARPSLAFVEQVIVATQTVIPTRKGGHLRLIELNPAATQSAGSGPSFGKQRRPVEPWGADRPDLVGTDHGASGMVLPRARRDRAADLAPGDQPFRPHESFRHECLLYRGTDAFLATVVPFVREGLAHGQPVMIAVIGPRMRALQAALGPDSERVRFVDMAEIGRNPARIIPAWREFIDLSGPDRQPVRGVGEPIWLGRREAETAEAQLHEALLNLAVCPDTPMWLLCPYDVSALPPEVVQEAHRSHPVVLEADTYRGSTEYGGTFHVESLFGGPLPARGADATTTVFDPAAPGEVARMIMRQAAGAGLSAERTAKLVTAINEIAVEAGAWGEVEISVWQDGPTLTCEVSDSAVLDDPMAGRRAFGSSPRDRSLRLANELCDLVQVRSNTAGTTVRVHTWR